MFLLIFRVSSMAQIKINKTNVDNLPFAPVVGKQSFYYDTELKGFGVRVSNQTKTYIVETKIQGKTVRVSIGKHGVITAEQARILAKNRLADMAQGINPNAVKREDKVKGITLKHAYDDYLAARPKLKETTLSDYKTCAEKYLEEWLHKPLIEINRDMVEQKHKALSENSKSRADLAMRFLHALYNFAKEYRDAKGQAIIIDNPVDRLSAKKLWNKVERRKTYIPPHKLKIWWDAVWSLQVDTRDSNTRNSETVRDYFLLLLFTGLRREEALTLCWDTNIDLDAKTLTVFDTKNGDDHMLPLSDFLYDLLLRRKINAKSNFVFPGDGKTGHIVEFRSHIDKIQSICGLRITPHDLRRTFISIVNSLTTLMSYYTSKKLLNHKISDVTAGYIQHNLEDLLKAMQSVATFILQKVTSEIKEPIGVEV